MRTSHKGRAQQLCSSSSSVGPLEHSNSLEHVTEAMHLQASSESEVNHNDTPPPYIALTSEALWRHSLYQASLTNDGSYGCIEVDQAHRVEGDFDALGIHSDSALHPLILHKPVGMDPMSRYQAPPFDYRVQSSRPATVHESAYPQQPDRRKDMAQQLNRAGRTQASSLKCSYAPSSNVAELRHGDRTCELEGSADGKSFTREQQNHILRSAYANNAQNRGTSLADIGTQFNAISCSEYAASIDVSDDAVIEGEE